jgi:hypothetical protein
MLRIREAVDDRPLALKEDAVMPLGRSILPALSCCPFRNESSRGTCGQQDGLNAIPPGRLNTGIIGKG